MKKNMQKFLWIIGLVLVGFVIVACQNKALPDTHMHSYNAHWVCEDCGDSFVAKLAQGSKGVADTKKITGLEEGKYYRVLVGGAKWYVDADGELTENFHEIGALTGNEITGLTERTATYNVIEAKLFTGSLIAWDHTGEGNMPNNIALPVVSDGKLIQKEVPKGTTLGINLDLSVDKTYEIVRLGDNPWGKTRVSVLYDYDTSLDKGGDYWIRAGETEAELISLIPADTIGLRIVTKGGNPPWLDGKTYIYTPIIPIDIEEATTLVNTYVVLGSDGTFKVLTVEVDATL